MKARMRDDVRRVATALWNLERRDYATGEGGPAFHTYADGKQEAMPLHLQPGKHQRYWADRARRVLRALRRGRRR